jgi:hypothetical protein
MSVRKRNWQSPHGAKSAWVCDYFDQYGKRRLRTFLTKQEAVAFQAQRPSDDITEAWLNIRSAARQILKALRQQPNREVSWAPDDIAMLTRLAARPIDGKARRS